MFPGFWGCVEAGGVVNLCLSDRYWVAGHAELGTHELWKNVFQETWVFEGKQSTG